MATNPSTKTFCVVIRDCNNRQPPRCVGKTRNEEQANLWKHNLQLCAMDADVWGKMLVFVWNERELLNAIEAYNADHSRPLADLVDPTR